ncbi:polyprenyl synthetase family protein [Ruminiclostridium papyrosolvens]|uniref:Farnesyl diphosphate synthase n=1 Tax=Ruminiclostridium papyrosolvens C7 TaxID=1330534 RepID=U4R3Z5_9FIRM|nr:farnesyl diphosphate synthase [Ruminiclostridium papyrosolvens]EPR13219.1 farnesyl-diphosphate synthase [Ruminiclostridium papyrosolvens C7]
MNFKEKNNIYVNMIEERLHNIIPEVNGYCVDIKEAMSYSLLAGGKRLRPLLALAVAEMFDRPFDEVINFGCAIEMIHTYSLIHDDLPAMDNDDYRRGKPTNHKVFGEAMAILAGDGLLNMAYEIIINDAVESRNIEKMRAAGIVAKYAGALGMVGGQVIDLQSEGKTIESDRLKTMHRLKTGALIKAPVEAAAVICGADIKEFELLSGYAANLGLAFQIKDDILDIEGTVENMGKNPGNDSSCNKSTYVTMFGLEESKKLLQTVTQEGISCLEAFGHKAQFLKELALSLVVRDR